MTYDYELTLIAKTSGSVDSEGIPTPSESKTVVYCGLKSIGRSEFYAAAASGLSPELTFIIHGYEYSGQTEVEFEGVRYIVIRTYAADFEEVELTCKKA
ncbi:MAG: phage head closure protein [Peptococcaceae bacterium]|nr:phage head closure protein [Peptococcaceae bacterium]